MKTLRASILCILVLALYSCSSYVAMKPQGEDASLHLGSDVIAEGELLTIQDGNVYLLAKRRSKDPDYASNVYARSSQVVAIQTGSVRFMQIEGIADRGWGWNVFLFQVIPTVLFTIAGASYGDGEAAGGAFIAFAIPTALTWLLFEASTPEAPTVRGPLHRNNIQKMNMYARFPKGTSLENIEAIARQCSFQEILYLD